MSTAGFQVELNPEHVNELERLRELAGAGTNRELFNNAVTLLKWAADEKQQGRAIVSLDEVKKNYRELKMPTLENIAVTGRTSKQQQPEG